jgi:hypothetical protein
VKGKPSISRIFIGFLMIISIIGSACNLLSNQPTQVATSQPTQTVEATITIVDTPEPEARNPNQDLPRSQRSCPVFSNYAELILMLNQLSNYKPPVPRRI